jgi:hypothetical protein
LARGRVGLRAGLKDITKKVKLFLQKAVEAYSPQKDFLVLVSVRSLVTTKAIVRLEELGKLKKMQSLYWEFNPRPPGI